MKRKNTWLALALCAVLTLTLTACGGDKGSKKGDVDPLAAAEENMANAASMEIDMTMNMDMEVMGETMKTVTGIDMTYFNDPMRMKADMTMDMGEMGSANMLMYADQASDGTITMYVNDGSGWMSETVSAEDLGQFDTRASMGFYLDSSSGMTQSGTETVNGTQCYRYTGKITGDAVKDVMMQSGALDSLGSSGLTESDLEQMLNGLGDIPITLWIGQESLYYVRMDMDMTACMNGLMEAMVESMGGADLGITMSVPKMTITMDCSNFNSAADFSIPAEALAG